MQIHTCIDKIKRIGPSQKFVLSIKCHKEYYDIRALWVFYTVSYLQLPLNSIKIRNLVITYCKFYILSTRVSIINDFAYFTYLLYARSITTMKMFEMFYSVRTFKIFLYFLPFKPFVYCASRWYLIISRNYRYFYI